MDFDLLYTLVDACTYDELVDVRDYLIERIRKNEKTCSVR